MLILCLELIKGRLGMMTVEIRKLFFFIVTNLIEKSPVSAKSSADRASRHRDAWRSPDLLDFSPHSGREVAPSHNKDCGRLGQN